MSKLQNSNYHLGGDKQALIHASIDALKTQSLEPCVRTLHIRGMDEDNPNRFWNNEVGDWVPEEHR